MGEDGVCVNLTLIGFRRSVRISHGIYLFDIGRAFGAAAGQARNESFHRAMALQFVAILAALHSLKVEGKECVYLILLGWYCLEYDERKEECLSNSMFWNSNVGENKCTKK